MTSARLLAVALATGVAYAVFVGAAMPMSGGHLNPAVTFAALMSKQIRAARAAVYIVSQCAGGVVGALLLTVMIPSSMHGTLGSDMLHASMRGHAVLASPRSCSPLAWWPPFWEPRAVARRRDSR